MISMGICASVSLYWRGLNQKLLTIVIGCCGLAAFQGSFHKTPPKPGVKTPGVQIPMSKLKPVASFSIPGAPDWIAVGEDVWVSNKPKGNVTRLDPKSNTVKQVITGLNKPCSGLAIGFGSLWVPNCGDHTLARIDLMTGKITTTIPTGIANSEGGIAVGAGSVWMVSDEHGSLARFDPRSNKVSATVALKEGCYVPAFGYGSLWVSCTKQNSVIRVDPKSNKIVSETPVGPEPRFLTTGEGGVWTLNQGNGSVTRLSPRDGKVEASIELGIPGEGGDISAGEGSVWATTMNLPITRIDPTTNKVVQQFVGPGGDALRAQGGSVWLSNYMLGIELRFNPKAIFSASR